MMNVQQVENLFMKECCVFGTENGVQAVKAAQYFGDDAICKVLDDCKPHVDWEIFSFGGKCSTICLYLSGLKYAATIANIMELTGEKPKLKDIQISSKSKEKLIGFPTKSTCSKKEAAGGGTDA